MAQIKAVLAVGAALTLLMSPSALAGGSTPALDTDPTWLVIVERFGVSTFLVMFVCAVVWRVTPHFVELIRKTTALVQRLDESVVEISKAVELVSTRIEAIERSHAEFVGQMGRERANGKQP